MLGLQQLKAVDKGRLLKGFSTKSLTAGAAKFYEQMNRDLCGPNASAALSRTHMNKKVEKDGKERPVYGVQVTDVGRWIALLIQLHEKRSEEQVIHNFV
jgi:hypothetical protein